MTHNIDGRCDRSLPSGRCSRKAVVVSNRTIFVASHDQTPYSLAYCSKHEKHANTVELPCLRVVSVVRLTPKQHDGTTIDSLIETVKGVE
jgi:hypothetical protein